MAPPTMPPRASSEEPASATLTSMLRWPVLPMLSRPQQLKSRLCQLTLPITLPMFMCTFSLVKLTANSTSVSQAAAVPPALAARLSPRRSRSTGDRGALWGAG